MNPRAATNDLLPFQGSPFGQLGYFSKMPAYYTRYTFLTHSSFVVICLNLLSCACAPSRKTKGSPFNSELPKRRGWDSNPRALSDKRFSRPPRYDHFDTSPNFLSFHRLNCLVRPRDNVYSSIILSEMSTTNFTFFQKNLNNYGTSNFMGCSGHPQYLKVPERQYTFPYRHALSVVSTV